MDPSVDGPLQLDGQEEEEAVEESRKYPDVILWSFKLCLKATQSNKNKKKLYKNSNKNVDLEKIFNLCIPATPQVQVAVCLSVPKSTTVPVPTSPILETL